VSEDVGLQYLLDRVRLVEQRIRELVAARRAEDPQPDDSQSGQQDYSPPDESPPDPEPSDNGSSDE